MGALLSNLKGGSDVGFQDVQINFEASQPSSGEAALYKELLLLQFSMPEILSLIRSYKGCAQEIREAISKPSEETNLAVWKALQPSIATSVKMYQYSTVLGACKQSLESNPGMAKLFVTAFGFIVDFDEVKSYCSDVQNDFSYYRRSINKFKMMDSEPENSRNIITDEEANHMSLFFAHHAPMFKAVAQTLTDNIKQKPERGPFILECLAGLAGASYFSINKQRVASAEIREELLRTMVMCTVLYDTLNPDGVFIKGSPIDVKQVVKTLTSSQSPKTDPLMNSLRFNLVHLNDKGTPKQIKALLGAN